MEKIDLDNPIPTPETPPVENKPWLSVLSNQEKKDLELSFLGTGRKYWLERLATELDLLPANVQKVVEEYLTTKKIPTGAPTDFFYGYIKNRQEALKLNAQKRFAVKEMRSRLKAIDERRGYSEKEKRERLAVKYDPEQKSLYATRSNSPEAPKTPITIGDIVADEEWGIKYNPDPDTLPPALWRRIRKLSDIGETRHQVEDLFNQEIVRATHIPEPTTTIPVKWLEEHYRPTTAFGGIIAERMAKTLLTRIQHNNPSLGLRIENSNVFEDVQMKYDFRVSLPKKVEGVAVEDPDLPRKEYVEAKQKIGVQFTLSDTRSLLKHKRRQLRKAREQVSTETRFIRRPVDDIILLSIPFVNYGGCFKRWLDNGKPPGGPEQYINREQKILILKKILEKGGVSLTDEEIAKLKI